MTEKAIKSLSALFAKPGEDKVKILISHPSMWSHGTGQGKLYKKFIRKSQALGRVITSITPEGK